MHKYIGESVNMNLLFGRAYNDIFKLFEWEKIYTYNIFSNLNNKRKIYSFNLKHYAWFFENYIVNTVCKTMYTKEILKMIALVITYNKNMGIFKYFVT